LRAAGSDRNARTAFNASVKLALEALPDGGAQA